MHLNVILLIAKMCVCVMYNKCILCIVCALSVINIYIAESAKIMTRRAEILNQPGSVCCKINWHKRLG